MFNLCRLGRYKSVQLQQCLFYSLLSLWKTNGKINRTITGFSGVQPTNTIHTPSNADRTLMVKLYCRLFMYVSFDHTSMHRMKQFSRSVNFHVLSLIQMDSLRGQLLHKTTSLSHCNRGREKLLPKSRMRHYQKYRSNNVLFLQSEPI